MYRLYYWNRIDSQFGYTNEAAFLLFFIQLLTEWAWAYSLFFLLIKYLHCINIPWQPPYTFGICFFFVLFRFEASIFGVFFQIWGSTGLNWPASKMVIFVCNNCLDEVYDFDHGSLQPSEKRTRVFYVYRIVTSNKPISKSNGYRWIFRTTLSFLFVISVKRKEIKGKEISTMKIENEYVSVRGSILIELTQRITHKCNKSEQWTINE